MASDLPFFTEAPSLDAAWLAYEAKNGLPNAPPTQKDISPNDALKLHQANYAKTCRERNALMMSPAGNAHDLQSGIQILSESTQAQDGTPIPLRVYIPSDSDLSFPQDFVVYYHGGGLCVGDLDSEDLQCRRIAKEAGIKVVSADYRLAPDHSPDTAASDAWDAFTSISKLWSYNPNQLPGNVYLVGSSSGGQLAAQVSQRARGTPYPISGLILRCPVTVDASRGGVSIPQRFEDLHTSFHPSFSTTLLPFNPDPDAHLPIASRMPLNADSFAGLPPTFLQLCTNDIFYSDGACYAQALREAGNDVHVQVMRGWPHTFWLKAPEMREALEADRCMIAWLRRLVVAK